MDKQKPSFFLKIPEFSELRILDLGCRSDSENVLYYHVTDSLPTRILGIDVTPEAEKAFIEQFSKSVNAKYVSACLGDGTEAVFFECHQETTSSLLRPQAETCAQYDGLFEATAITAERPIKTITLDSLLDEWDFDLLKSDLQGSDLQVLQNGSSVLSCCCVAIIEVDFISQYSDGPHFRDLLCFLESRGFLFHSFIDYGTRPLKGFSPEWSRVKRGYRQWLWANAVFVKQPSLWESLDDKKLAKFAAIMHHQLSAYDYAWKLLQVLDGRHCEDIRSRSSEYLAFLAASDDQPNT